MKIEIQCDGMTLSKDLQELIERRIAFVLGTHSDSIKSVRVHLTWVNEPRDGKDKSCQVQGILASGKKVMVEIMDSDLHVAIHRAVDRAGWTVSRRLQRELRQASREFAGLRNLHGHPEPENRHSRLLH